MLWMLMIILAVLFILNFPMYIAMIVAPLAVVITYFPNLDPLLAT